MAVLYIDLGNTRAKWLYEDAERKVVENRGAALYESLKSALTSLKADIPQARQVVVASVLKQEKTIQIFQMISSIFHIPVHQCVVTRNALGVECAYEQPERLGIDRWLVVLAAWIRFSSACHIVDLGTALTIDCIDRNGLHGGGYIVSGLELGIKGLLSGTDNIRPDAGLFEQSGLEPGKSTAQAVYRGALMSAVGIIELSYAQAVARDADTTLILLGGDSQLVGPYLNSPYHYLDDAVFTGMSLLWKGGLTLPVSGLV